MAASLANHAIEAQLSVGLIAWSHDGWVKVPPNRGKRHRRDVLTILRACRSTASTTPMN